VIASLALALLALVAVPAPRAQAEAVDELLLLSNRFGPQSGTSEAIGLRQSGGTFVDITGGIEPDTDGNFDVSRDGSKIVYVEYPNPITDPDQGGIAVINIDGSGHRWLTRSTYGSPFTDQAPAWSPDGTQVVFSRALPYSCSTFKLYVMSADGGAPAKLTNNNDCDSGHNELYPAWSPDGTKVVYAAEEGGRLKLANADGSGTPSSLTTTNDHDHPDSYPVWSRDGSKVYFSAFDGQDSMPHISRINANGSSRQQVTADGTSQEFPSVSADGDTIVYLDDGSAIKTENSDGSGSPTTVVSSGTYWYNFPVFVPVTIPSGSPTANYAVLGDSVSAAEGIYYDWRYDPDGNNGDGQWTRATSGEPTWDGGGRRAVLPSHQVLLRSSPDAAEELQHAVPALHGCISRQWRLQRPGVLRRRDPPRHPGPSPARIGHPRC
jgi:Tol biopolymer transport system component